MVERIRRIGHELRTRWALVTSLLLAMAALLALMARPHIALWPGNEAWSPYGFSDQDHQGNSRNLGYSTQGDILSTRFVLSDAPDRYGGIVLNSAGGRYQDFSQCSFLRLHYRTLTEDPLRVQLVLDVPGRTHPDQELTRRYLFWELPPSLVWRRVDVPLSQLQTPDWWFRQNHIPPSLLPAPDFSRVLSVAVSESEFTPAWKTLGVELRSVEMAGPWWPTLLLAFLTPFPLLLRFQMRRRRVRGSPLLQTSGGALSTTWEVSAQELSQGIVPELVQPFGRPLPILDREEQDFDRIVQFIAERYADPELALAVVNRETGIPESRISTILEKRTGLHFKPYLNRVRIDEATRLLSQSKQTISEIAFLVGYSNTTHFNRVFKSLKQVSPEEFRRGEKE